jgi:ATP synthase protein I
MLGGLGLGWLFDTFLHTIPFGLISGMLLGTGLSLFVAVRGAIRTADAASKAAGPTPAVPDDDDDE